MKKTKEQIKEDTDKIISSLKKHGSNLKQVAKDTGFSRQKIWRNIKRLEEDGVICGYSTVINQRKTDKRRFILLLKRKCIPFSDGIDILDSSALQREAKLSRVEIEDVMLTNGYYDMVITVLAKSIVAVNSFNESLCYLFQALIDDIIVLDGLYQLQESGQEVVPIGEVKKFYAMDY